MIYISMSVAVAIVAFLRRKGLSWFAPPLLLASVWLAYIAAIAGLGRDFRVDFLGIWFVTLCVVVFAVPYTAMITSARLQLGRGNPRHVRRPSQRGIIHLQCAIYGCSFLGLLGTLDLLAGFGFSLVDMSSSQGVLTVGNAVAVGRYGGYEFSYLTLIGLAALYCAAILTGYCLAGRVGPPWALASAPLGVAVFYSTVTTARTGLLYVILLGVASWAANSLRMSLSFPNVRAPRLRTTLIVVALIGVVVILFVGLAWVRTGVAGAPSPVIMTKIRTAIAGGLPAFTLWFSEAQYDLPAFATGSESVRGFALIRTEPVESFPDMTVVGSALASGTTVYTAFRPLIEDFGLAGALVALMCLSLVGAYAHRAVLVFGSRIGSMFLTALLASILWSGVISILSYRVIVAALLGSFAAIAFAEKGTWSARSGTNGRRELSHRASSSPVNGVAQQTARGHRRRL